MKTCEGHHWTEQYYSELDDIEREEAKLILLPVGGTQKKRGPPSCYHPSHMKGYNQESQNKNKTISPKPIDYRSVFKLLNTHIYIPFFSLSHATSEEEEKDEKMRPKAKTSKALNRDTRNIQSKRYESSHALKQRATNKSSKTVNQKVANHNNPRNTDSSSSRMIQNRGRDDQLNTHQQRRQELSHKNFKRRMKTVEKVQMEGTESGDTEAIYRVLSISHNYPPQPKTERLVLTGDESDLKSESKIWYVNLSIEME